MASVSLITMSNAHFDRPVRLPVLLKTPSDCKIRQLRVGLALRSKLEEKAHSSKDKMAASLTAGILSAAVMVPDVATAVEEASGGSSSLKNFLLSIAAGGVVLAAILFAVLGVSNFDPVKRN